MSGIGGMGEDDEEYNANKRRFQDFLDADDMDNVNMKKVQSMLDDKKTRFLLDLDDLRAFDADLCSRVLQTPLAFVPAFESALKDVVLHIDPSYGKNQEDVEFHIGFMGSFGRHHVTPRSLLSNFLESRLKKKLNFKKYFSKIYKVSLVRPKVVRSVHYCPKTGKSIQREYRDATSTSGLPTGKFGWSSYKDHQTLVIQEMPEHAPMGQLPCAVDVVLVRYFFYFFFLI
eukprot:GSMAST32.ASY1.ANO1.735.1 assembled CDS